MNGFDLDFIFYENNYSICLIYTKLLIHLLPLWCYLILIEYVNNTTIRQFQFLNTRINNQSSILLTNLPKHYVIDYTDAITMFILINVESIDLRYDWLLFVDRLSFRSRSCNNSMFDTNHNRTRCSSIQQLILFVI